MRLPALLFVTVLALLPAAARAQVVVQDQAETFLDDRSRHMQRMDANPEKWWGGDVYDRASSTTLYDPNEFSDTPQLLNVPGAKPGGQPTQAAATPIPGNPETVKPMFSFDDMTEAEKEGAGGEAPIDFSNPTDLENAALRMGVNAMRIMGGGVGGGVAPQDLPQPVGAQDAAPAPERAAEPLPVAAPYVPSDPKPAAPPIAPPPVQDEIGATKINPADAPADSLTDPAATAQPAAATTTAIPALEDAAAAPATDAAATAQPAAETRAPTPFGTGIVPGRDEEAAPTDLTP